jgi:hypothetical protein
MAILCAVVDGNGAFACTLSEIWLLGGHVGMTGIDVLQVVRSSPGNSVPLVHAHHSLTPARRAFIPPSHDDHDHDPPRYPPTRLFGAGGRSLIVTRAAEGRAAHLPISAPILVA